MIRRVLQAVVVLLLVILITFALLRLIPGNPAIAVMGPSAYRNPAAITQFDRVYGFNKPWYAQYWLWLDHLLHFNLSYSLKLNQSVASPLGTHLPKTVFLVGISIILALVLAIPIGVLQAVRRNKIVDHFFNGFSTVFYAMPAFLLILIFANKFPVLPAEGPQGENVGAIFSQFNAMILPIATLTLIALFSRYMRSSVLDNLTEDHVRTAKANEASVRRVLLRHVLRNSLIPIATLLGLLLPALFAGALITESVFNYPGMGYLWRAPVDPDAVPGPGRGVDDHPEQADPDPGDRADLVADHFPAGPRRGAIPAHPRLRPGHEGHGRRRHPRRAAAYRAQRHRHDHGHRDLHGRRRDRTRRGAELPGAGDPPAADRLGRDAVQRRAVRLRRLLVADHPGRILHRRRDRRRHLHLRRATRRGRSPAPAPLSRTS
ncbi:MAG TPA: ABC transporter permease [Streptosporangiaceae bacterium]|nr:ABC transporter permease [Streptosporangiaceae bacterium]